MKVRVILHLHTDESSDSNITINELISQLKLLKVKYIGITDHNRFSACENFKGVLKQAGITLIPGEEIRTDKGEIIGLFLKKNIESKNTSGKRIQLQEAIKKVKDQGGIVIAPHPFDRMRLGIGKKNLLNNKDEISAIEIFNSRTKLNFFNKKAQKFASEYNFKQTVGPDAHIADEIGNAIIEMDSFANKEEFLHNLDNAVFITKRLKLRNVIRPTINKFKKFVKRKK